MGHGWRAGCRLARCALRRRMMNAANAAACVRTASAAAKRHGFMSVDAALVDRRQQAVHPCGGCRRLLQQSEHWPPGLWRQQRQRGSSAVPPPATTAHRRMLDGCVDGHPSMDPSMVYNWLDSWRGGKGASLRPVSLGRSSVHPGACGNHGTWPIVASLGHYPHHVGRVVSRGGDGSRGAATGREATLLSCLGG